MKSLLKFLLILGILTGVGGLLVWAGDRDDEVQAIQTLVKNLVQAYNADNEAALGKLLAGEGDWASVPGRKPSKGTQAILQEIKQGRSGDYRGGQLNLAVTSIKFVGKNAAFVEATNRLTGVVTPRGTHLPPIDHHMILLLEKDKKDWLIHAVRWYSAVPIVRGKTSPPLYSF